MSGPQRDAEDARQSLRARELLSGRAESGAAPGASADQRMAVLEEAKSMPWAAVYDYFCYKNNVPVAEDYITEIEKYEKEITSKR